VGFNDQDQKILRANADWGQAIAEEMATRFYDYMGKDKEMNAILHAKEGRIHNLKKTFCQWFYEMFTGIDMWGQKYADSRWRIGLVHVKIGIGPQHVVPAMAVVVNAVRQKFRQDGKSEALGDALGKICMIDLAFIEQAYVEVSAQAVLRETGWTEGLLRRLITTGAGSM
ncbi:MAG: protoglobin domain-containing protein, partial [Pseudanabaenaceae cyanobacterium]